ncbi:MAG: NAD(P)/FAD-dependent oxidoreductase [Nitrospirae bacterium]|nr:MAG: NAD(P)/FAD-dependent oxidoreductase [Nitrospirota bacterium]
MRVVIVGGGFAGTFLAYYLCEMKASLPGLEIILISRTNYLLFQPFMVEAITGDIDIRHLISPLRAMLNYPCVDIRTTDAESVDFNRRIVYTSNGTVSYDKLIVATGSETNFYGIPGAKESCLELKQLKDVLIIRNTLLKSFERANIEENKETQSRHLTFAVIGAGPTGVELATGMCEFIHETLLKYYHRVHIEAINILLIDAAPRLLPGFETSLVEWAENRIKHMNIKLMLNHKVQKIDGDIIEFTNGSSIEARTIIWTAGIQASSFVRSMGLPYDHLGRLSVDSKLKLPNRPDVFVLGDAARAINLKTGEPLPPEGQVALQQAKYVANLLVAEQEGRPYPAFKFIRLGRLASLGSKNAITQILWFRFKGFKAWWLWRSVYLFRYRGMRNKLRILFDWTFSLFFDRDISLIE